MTKENDEKREFRRFEQILSWRDLELECIDMTTRWAMTEQHGAFLQSSPFLNRKMKYLVRERGFFFVDVCLRVMFRPNTSEITRSAYQRDLKSFQPTSDI